ncbi:MAG: hypothetical protein LBL66_06185 [Clostridiales bacterium]|jgi:hypothetical protein|nr:hypothetical protein [Clostridiales bacterium]
MTLRSLPVSLSGYVLYAVHCLRRFKSSGILSYGVSADWASPFPPAADDRDERPQYRVQHVEYRLYDRIEIDGTANNAAEKYI